MNFHPSILEDTRVKVHMIVKWVPVIHSPLMRHIRQKRILVHTEGWTQDYSNSNIFLKPLFRGNLDPFVNNANLGAIAHTSNGT